MAESDTEEVRGNISLKFLFFKQFEAFFILEKKSVDRLVIKLYISGEAGKVPAGNEPKQEVVRMKFSSTVVFLLMVLATAGKADVTIRYEFTNGSLNDTYGVANLTENWPDGGMPCADKNGTANNAYEFLMNYGHQGLRSPAGSDAFLSVNPDSVDSLVVSFDINSAYDKGTEERILSWGAKNTGFSILLHWDTLTIRGFMSTFKTKVSSQITGQTVRNSWHTVRMVYRSNMLRVYIDNNQAISQVVGEYNPTISTTSFISVAIDSSAANLFNGRLDNIEIRLATRKGTSVFSHSVLMTERHVRSTAYSVFLNGRVVSRATERLTTPKQIFVQKNR